MELNPYAPPQTSNLLPQADSLAPILVDAVYPLRFRFKIWTLSPRVEVTDANGRLILYVKQKIFRLKEHLEVFADRAESQKIADIKASKILDWSLRYHFRDAKELPIGELGRRGLRSLWRANYDVFNPGDEVADFHIREENPWAKLGDATLGQIPLIGILSVFLFHPRYVAKSPDGSLAMRLRKQPAFLEGKFLLEREMDLPIRQQMNLMLSFLMLVFLERRRG